MLVKEYLIIGWIRICVICIGLSVKDRKYLRVNVFIGHIGIQGLMLKLIGRRLLITVICFSSVAQSCLTLCDPMDCSIPGLPVYHQLLEPTQTHVHWVGDANSPSHPSLSPSPPAFNLSQHQGLFTKVSSLHQVEKYWSFSFSISPSNEYSGLISFSMDWLDPLGL